MDEKAGEEERVKGDFDGAIDLLVEDGTGGGRRLGGGVGPRVRVVRSEMEPVFRRLLNGGRKQVKPLAKVASEERLLRRLEEALKEEEFS